MAQQHIVSPKVYIGVFAALLFFTLLTVAVHFINLGEWNVVLAITIAVIKGLLVMLFFMHVRYSSQLLWVFVGAGFFWLVILVGLTMSDYSTRGWLPFSGR